MKITKKQIPLILHSVLAIVLVCVIIVSAIIIMNPSVAWFATNDRVNANEAAVDLSTLGITDKYYSRYGDGEFAEITSLAHVFEKLTPGDTVTVKAEYTSEAQEDINLKVYFRDMGDGEVPLVTEDGKYCYFGTQLRVTQKTMNGATPEDVNAFLVEPPTDKVYYDAQAAANDIHLGDITVTAGATYTLEFTVEFINYPNIDQNVYQKFGAKTDSTEKCYRQLVAIVE